MPQQSQEPSTMTKLKVFLPINPQRGDIPDHFEAFQKFQKEFDVIIRPMSSDLEEWKTALAGELSDISAIWITNVVFTLAGEFNSLIDFFPPSLRVIAVPWVGHDRFDGVRLREKGIVLCNVGDSSAKDVADIALYLALGTFRYTSYFDKAFRENKCDITATRRVIGGTDYDSETKQPLVSNDPARLNWAKYMTVGGKSMDSPSGKIAGIVGLGAIGKEIALRLWALGMKIVYTKRTPLSEEEVKALPYEPVYYSSFEEMVPHVDLLALAVPNTPQTENLINENTIKLFKKGSRIVNIGRGNAIDEEVLLKALDDGTLNSVGLDVFRNEPKVDKRFADRFDVVLAPHLGSFTMDNFRGAAERTIENIRNVIVDDGPGICPVN